MPRGVFGGTPARRRRQARGGNTPPPATTNRKLPSLEEVIIALQKSLARSQRDARERSRADTAFVDGDQPLYIVDAIDVDMNVALRAEIEEGDEAPQRVLVDFDAPPDQRSALRLRVESRPLEALGDSDGKLLLADLDPSRRESPRRRLMASWVGRRPDAPLTFRLVIRAGEQDIHVPFGLNTVGQAEIFIDPTLNVFSIGQGEPRPIEGIDLRQTNEFFVWVEAGPSREGIVPVRSAEEGWMRSRIVQTLGEGTEPMPR